MTELSAFVAHNVLVHFAFFVMCSLVIVPTNVCERHVWHVSLQCTPPNDDRSGVQSSSILYASVTVDG